MGSYRSYDGRSEAEEDAYSSIFKTLTIKQHEVYALVAEGRSSKEIAWKLGITDSAVNQRIEAVRSRAGSPTRAELARAYRGFRQAAICRPLKPPCGSRQALRCPSSRRLRWPTVERHVRP